MKVTSLSLFPKRRPQKNRDWSNQEIADFYRAMDILKQAGLNTEVDSGVSDEGDPWFVFLRPENGDVIAHFASIDGEFIAVSSLHSRIYRGANIRSIVDQMLDRHPLLMPQPKNGGRILLHPAAALTAFLAAAFILGIDGVKATNISEVLVNALPESNAGHGGSGPGVGEVRMETMKGMLSELSVSNYNVAVLGAALIVHELTGNWEDLSLEVQSSEDITKLDGDDEEHISEVVATDKYLADPQEISDLERISDDNSNGIHDRYNSYSDEQSALSSEQNNHSGDYQHNPEKELKLIDSVSHKLKASFQNEIIAWDTEGSDLQGFFKLNTQSEFSNSHNKIGAVDTAHADEEPEAQSYNHELVLGYFNTVFQLAEMEFGSEFKIGSEVTTLTRSDVEGLVLVQLEELKITENRFLFSNDTVVGDVSVIAGDPVSLNDVLLDSNGTMDLGANEPIASPIPILAHSFVNPDNVLKMTDAIDVVFYRGGTAEISGFELGRDILWFTLKKEELAQSSNTINQDGDLILDFGDSGMLKFLGVVPQLGEDLSV